MFYSFRWKKSTLSSHPYALTVHVLYVLRLFNMSSGNSSGAVSILLSSLYHLSCGDEVPKLQHINLCFRLYGSFPAAPFPFNNINNVDLSFQIVFHICVSVI